MKNLTQLAQEIDFTLPEWQSSPAAQNYENACKEIAERAIEAMTKTAAVK